MLALIKKLTGKQQMASWTPKEDEYLRTRWVTCTAQEIAEGLNRTSNAVSGRAKRISLIPSPYNVPLFEVTENGCRWPTNSKPPYTFCNKQKTNITSYCEEHSKKAYRIFQTKTPKKIWR